MEEAAQQPNEHSQHTARNGKPITFHTPSITAARGGKDYLNWRTSVHPFIKLSFSNISSKVSLFLKHFFGLMAVFFSFSECFCICSVGSYKGEKCRTRMREILHVDNSCTSTQATHALFTQVASTPGELLAAVLLASSQPGLEDLMQIICFSTTRKGKGEGFRRDFVSSCSSV